MTTLNPTSEPTPAVSPRPARATRSGFFNFDVWLVAVVAGLLIFGLMMVFSATFDWSYRAYGDAATIFLRQLQWVGIGLAVMLVMMHLDYHWLRRLAVPLMAVTLLLLVGVLVFGSTVFNAQRSFWGGSVQPSELAKLVTIIYLAVWLAAKGDKVRTLSYGMVPFIVIVGVLAALILLQPDLSAAGTIVIIALLMLFIAGADLLQMGVVASGGALTTFLLLQMPFSFAATGRQRLADYLAGLQDVTQASWHMKQAAIAFVNGSWFGRGLGQSHQKFGFLPTPHTDSIFAVIGEELGLVGALVVVALFVLLVWRGFRIAARAKDSLGAILAAALVCWIALEAFINISVMVGLAPFAGNALPFISYGGSNLVVTLTGVGILLNISRPRTDDAPKRATPGQGWFNATFDFSRRDGRGRVSRSSRR